VILGSRYWRWAAISLVAAVAIGNVLFYLPQVVDDAFIYFRYAEQWAAGEGLVYNVGQRVEGFSSFPWVALLAIGAVVGVNLVTWSKILGVASLAALLVGQYRFARERIGLGDGPGWRRLLPYAAPLATACCSYVMSWGIYGLETPLYLALLVWSAVVLGRYVDRPSPRRLAVAGAVCGAFGLSRPEAPLMLAAITGALALTAPASSLRDRAVRIATGIAPAVAVFAAYLTFRLFYFGLLFEHPYYAKTSGQWDLANLRALVSDGAAPAEIALVLGGVAIAAAAAWRRRDAIVVAVAAANAVFAARVHIDWMPNMRFWLPLFVLVPHAWLWAIAALGAPAERAGPAGRVARRLLAAAAVAVLALTMVHQVRMDMRYTIFSYRARGSKRWVKPKMLALWRDTWRCLHHEWPDYVYKQDKLNMGMITQVYRLIESDARPLEETWFIGPDIGMVGYLTPVNVWEPAALFTPDVRTKGQEFKLHHKITPELLAAAVDRPVAMTELFDRTWTDLIRKDPVLSQRFEPTYGWSYLRERGAPPPSREQILARYRYALSKFPSSYYVMLLHGSALGAELDRRATIVETGTAPPAPPR